MSGIKITIPTYLTISRFFLVPIFIYLFMQKQFFWAFITLVVAGLTDMLDGLIARRFHMRSRLGAMLDPLADKFLMLVSFTFLSHQNIIPWELTLLIVGRDFAIVVSVFILGYILKIRLLFKPTRISKLATASQIIVLAAAFLHVLLKHSSYYGPQILSIYVGKSLFFLSMACFILTSITVFQYGYLAHKFYRYGQRMEERKIIHPID